MEPKMTIQEGAAYNEALGMIEDCLNRRATKLDLMLLNLKSLPPEIGQLTSLTQLILFDNDLTSLPPEIGELTSLTELNLSYNQFTSLPPEIRQLTAMKGLYLHGNAALEIPAEVLGTKWGEEACEVSLAKPQDILRIYFTLKR
jgi:Leucine-rich repeat (LRR) protein